MTLKEFLDRYGPTVAIVTMVVVLGVLLPGNTKGGGSNVSAGGTVPIGTSDGTTTSETIATADGTAAATVDGGASVSAGGTTTGAAGTSTARPGTPTPSKAVSGGAVTPQAATVQQSQSVTAAGVKFGSGPNCREDGRQKSFSYAAPPCADWTPGTPNGGGTDKGVTGDKILVIRYRAQENAATSAALTGAGASDSRDDTETQYQAFTKYFNQHYETYGREVVMKVFDASGAAGNDEAERADAIKMADELGAFAVLNAGTVGAAELARRGVICLCTVTLSRSFYGALPPYIFSSLPTAEDYGTQAAEYVGKRLAGRNATFAGDALFKANPRRFGYVWYEGEGGRADPVRKVSHDVFVDELAKYNVSLSGDFAYIFDIAKAPDQADAMVAKFRDAKVSTVILGVDPLYPIFFTQSATKNNYNPEWIILGTALSDTTFFGRTYDKKQMQAAFGISPLYVSWADFKSSPGWKEYHSGNPAANPNDTNGKVAVNVTRSGVATLFSGIQMAGPNLNQDTFSQGLFNLPPIGGTPARPLIKFTRRDPTAIKDFNEIYWDSTFQGKDEVNKDGVGAFLHVNGGKRYQAGQWPESEPKVFTRDGAVFTSDNPEGGPQAVPYDDKVDKSKRCLSCP